MDREVEATSGDLPRVLTTRASLSSAVKALRSNGRRVGLVPTMGALHDGHLSLVDASRQLCEATVATIFVNPTQFGPGEDFERYPRPLGEDLKLLAARGVDLVYAPGDEEMYDQRHQTFVTVGTVAKRWEGAHRPEHFRGVATVCLKLFNLIPADMAFFGQKDFQQTRVIEQMVSDLNIPIEIRVCPIVREADGLALSSRNVYLSEPERERALAIPRSLQLARERFAGGHLAADDVIDGMTKCLREGGVTSIDYVGAVDRDDMAPVEQLRPETVVVVAAGVGRTRLIDNHILGEPFKGEGEGPAR